MLKKILNNEEEKLIDPIKLYPKKKFKTKRKIKNTSSKNKHIKKFISLSLIIILFIIILFIYLYFSNINKNLIENQEKIIKKFIIEQKNLLKSYDEIGEMIFSQNNFISFNVLDEYYYGLQKNNTKFNDIHILFAFDNNYYLLASVTITSILKIANTNSYMHFHIIASRDFKFETMKKLNRLKTKINNNTEFIFYNGTKAEEDFGEHIRGETYSSGEYAKLLGPELIDKNIDRVIALDAGDIFVEKDLLELYNFPLDDYLVRGVEDPYAPCNINFDYFFTKEGYINAGVVFYNLKKWREMNIYQDILKFYKFFDFKGKLTTPHQDILNCFLPSSSIGKLPLKYNHVEYIDLNKNEDQQEEPRIYIEECSYFHGKADIVFEAERNVVIRHYNKHKIYEGNWNYLMTKKWLNYANMTGFYENICNSYSNVCNKI